MVRSRGVPAAARSQRGVGDKVGAASGPGRGMRVCRCWGGRPGGLWVDRWGFGDGGGLGDHLGQACFDRLVSLRDVLGRGQGCFRFTKNAAGAQQQEEGEHQDRSRRFFANTS